jgi:uncharacterized membrane protein
MARTSKRRGRSNRRSGTGRWLMITAAAVGGYVLYRQVQGKNGKNAQVHVSKSITIERPVGEIYGFWRDLENLPKVMNHLASVQVLPDGRSHWVAKGPMGSRLEWDAETLVDRQNEVISWRSTHDAAVPNEGSVRFRPIDAGRTEVRVSFTYHPPGGEVGAAVAKLFGEEPSQRLAEDLRRLKQELETGAVVTSAYARPSGREAGT